MDRFVNIRREKIRIGAGMDESRIFRYGAPGKLDTAPFGTECYVAQVNKPNEYEVYKQYSTNEEDPNWIFVEYKIS